LLKNASVVCVTARKHEGFIYTAREKINSDSMRIFQKATAVGAEFFSFVRRKLLKINAREISVPKQPVHFTAIQRGGF
jgi:hypothetical protein